MIQASTQFPSIDYTAHPAFRQFSPADPSQDAAIEQAVRQIDEVLEEIQRRPRPSRTSISSTPIKRGLCLSSKPSAAR